METFTMSRKELPRPGLLAAAVAGRITHREGAAALRITPRQFQRLKQRFREGGPLAVRHQGRRRPSHRRLAAGVGAQVQALLQDRYAGFNDTHLTEKLRELHGLAVSRESVRRLRRALGWPAVHRRRPAQHRARRPRAAAAGQLLQIDGSPFPWLEGRGPAMTLLGAIDEATSTVIALHFRPTEDLHGYATLLHQVFTTVGLPVALYGDGVNILVRTDRHWTLAEQRAGTQAPTHLGRVLHELGIGSVQARSPQGNGRGERLWGTLQDRLVSQLRLRAVATRAAANAFLPEFLADFNRRFARPPGQPQAVWRRPPASWLSCSAAAIRVGARATTPSGWARACCKSRAARTAAPTPGGGARCASCSTGASSSWPTPRSLPARPRRGPTSRSLRAPTPAPSAGAPRRRAWRPPSRSSPPRFPPPGDPIPGVALTTPAWPSPRATPSAGDDIFTWQYPRHFY
jgi:transposase